MYDHLQLQSWFVHVCKKTVTIRQDALQCDACDNWQHRLCETGKLIYVLFVCRN